VEAEIPPITPYTTDLEARVIDQIESARKSIFIAVAWLTNRDIIQALHKQAYSWPALSIQVVVDDNVTNRDYFLPWQTKLEEVGIIIQRKHTKRFLHHKFVVVDESRVLVGSYNFTKKGNHNRENLNLIRIPFIAEFYQREFLMLTSSTYIDPNIELLLRYPVFAQQLLSANYPFTAQDLKKYRNKITVGECYSAPNGLYNELNYAPGFIFNPICRPAKLEFPLPITKETLHRVDQDIVFDFGREYFLDNPEDEHSLGEYIEQNLAALEAFYARKFEHTYPVPVLEKKIVAGIDIIRENYLWPLNFQPFCNKRVMEVIMPSLADLSQTPGWHESNGLLQKKARPKAKQRRPIPPETTLSTA
jgi:hypothetical protein